MLLEMSSLGKLLQLLGRRVDQLHGTLRRAIPNLIRSDAAEGTEFVYPAVDAAEREEHSSFDHSIGTDSGLTKAAANEISEGLYLRRYSVAEKIAYMMSLIRTWPKSPISSATENAVSYSHSVTVTVTVILNESLTNC